MHAHEPEYLVKWAGRAHVHNEWVRESSLLGIARRKLLNFKKRHGDAPCDLSEPEWSIPERLVARRPALGSPGWEVLVKWRGQGYDACTWEPDGSGPLMQPERLPLHLQLWARQRRALERAGEAGRAAAAAAEARAQQQGVPELTSQPEWVRGAALMPHQLSTLNWLRAMWARRQSCVLADEAGCGKTATVAAHLAGLIADCKAAAPALVVVPLSMLPFWEGELAFWLPEGANIVAYSGSVAARNALHDHELWLQASSMDGKVGHSAVLTAAARGAASGGRVPKPDVVLTTYEAASSDLHALRALPWCAVALDLRQRSRSAAGKAHAALQELTAGSGVQRLVLTGHRARGRGPDELFNVAALVRPAGWEEAGEALPEGLDDPEAQVGG
ncbi:SNF2 family DNA-dependent ATPase [Monoraphidium neglectum]|uniref:SNF2 family DNA-dependent ATPase n=1 Tax=Monoraphidium neglectum TaxID=145388 RepID=A0A0D2K8F1_9CHLO|nr:SNF2 family DNA-dependent ATPase [Monoraphidium neglectum]KIY92413.1 SNF2 family DNA-dependent ATPase [Monoraphidium neglectum]|eukprot:XP_013891433.1 SNF2 family DNA-dependent ATPase [Monoraphidium neglectum]